MFKRNPEVIKAQIEGLKNMKNTLPEYSTFGNNNWEIIDAQLDVLEGLKSPDEFYIDETTDEFRDGDNDVYFAAQQAEDWLNGDSDEDLFE